MALDAAGMCNIHQATKPHRPFTTSWFFFWGGPFCDLKIDATKYD